MTSEGSQLSAGFDLSQFYQVFFEEAAENLERMEQLLLDLDIEAADDEELNAIFRCAHSIKGGAATFGFSDVAELTHQMETLLDKLRRHELQPTAAMVDVLLASGDALKAQIARHQTGAGDEVDTTELLFNIRAMAAGEAPPVPVVTAPAVAVMPAVTAAPAPARAPTDGERTLELRVGPLPDPSVADNLVELFKEITDLGHIEALDGGVAQEGVRRFKVVTRSAESELLDLFTFHVSKEHVRFVPLSEAAKPAATQPPAASASADPGYGFFDDAPGAEKNEEGGGRTWWKLFLKKKGEPLAKPQT
ncbi:Hpt domain-containing protein, partial [Caldimonas sp.]|uniref:Hpt domain-containing protein n=1 Tax=Caldimonas sp. TaxID=2838790 RepID=UPI00391B88F9